MRYLPLLMLLAACATPEGLPTDSPLDTDPQVPLDTDLVLDTDLPVDEDACVPALGLTAPVDATVPLGIVDLQASGGTGAYRFTLIEPERGIGFVESSLGRLLVGDTPGVPHIVELTDDDCEGRAEIVIDVVPNLGVIPDRATVLPGASFILETTGGLGEPTCTLLESLSGAVLEDCAYTAGPEDGLDRIEVIDEESGDRVIVRITVEADSVFGVAESGWWLPLDGTHQVQPASGSGHFSVEVLEGEAYVAVEGDAVFAREVGRARIRVRDRFSGHTADIPVAVVPPLQPPLRPTARGRFGEVVGEQDFDGDGYDDVLIALPEFDRDHRDAGLVAIYKGGPAGLSQEPVLEFGPELAAQTRLGTDIAVGDWNGDGEADLAIGAYGHAGGLTDRGGVYLIPSFMEADPSTLLEGPALRGALAYDRFGSGVALCDFDGDGHEDLAVGSYGADSGGVSNTGAIHIYSGDGSSFSEEPTATRFGQAPQPDGSWEPARLYMGLDLLAADVDGDGLCDLISSDYYGTLDGIGQDGVVSLFRGSETEGIELHPSRMLTWDGDYTYARMGWSIDVDDLDGDGMVDLFIGSYLPEGTRGVVHAFMGEDWLGDGPLVRTMDDSTWYLRGDQGGDQLGHQLHVTDADGDGVKDLLISATFDESSEARRNAGQVWIFEGDRIENLRGRGPHNSVTLKALPVDVTENGSYIGILAGPAGDTDGDGVREVFIHTLRDEHDAFAGNPEVVPIGEGEPRMLMLEHGLDQPGVGTAMAMGDASGDGQPDAIVGAWTAADTRYAQDAGSLWSFARTEAGFSPWASELRRSYNDRFAGDRLGRSMTAEVDLDGDGYRDLIVASERAWRPGTLSTDHVPRTCGAWLRRAGAVHVYRGGLRGFEVSPSLVVFGAEEEGYIERVEPAGDVDGDGYADVLIGSGRWGSGGGAYLLRGRPLSGRGTETVCMEADERWLADESGAAMGRAMTALGDLDGDGCDDVAIGSYGENRGRSNQGLVRIIWGGGPGCNTRPSVTQLASGSTNAYAGETLAGGSDLDGDGIPDLLIGAPRFGNGGSGGVVWAVSGASLLRHDREPIIGALPRSADLPAPRLDSIAKTLTLREPSPRARFGSSLEVLPGDPGLAIIGRSDLAGGGLLIYALDDGEGGFSEAPLPSYILAGEPIPGGLGRHAVCYADERILMVGAPTSDANSGAVYALPLDLGAP